MSEALLSICLESGRRVLASAAMVGDLDDQRFWRVQRELWVHDTARRLSDAGRLSTMQEFRSAISSAQVTGASASESLAEELEGLQRGIALLAEAQGTPAG